MMEKVQFTKEIDILNHSIPSKIAKVQNKDQGKQGKERIHDRSGTHESTSPRIFTKSLLHSYRKLVRRYL